MTPLLLALLLDATCGTFCWNQATQRCERCADEQPINIGEPDPIPTPAPTPIPPPTSDFTFDGAAGGIVGLTSGATQVQETVELAVGFNVKRSDQDVPRLDFLGRFGVLPGEIDGFNLDSIASFRSASLEVCLHQGIGLRLRPALLVGFETRLEGDETPLTRTARFIHFGVRVQGPEGYLFAGAGGDERLSAAGNRDQHAAYVPTFLASWRLRVAELVKDRGVHLYLTGRALLYMRLGYEWETTPDSVQLGLMAGWGNRGE